MMLNVSGTCLLFLFKQKTSYEVRISDWSSDVCSSDLKEITNIKSYPERQLSRLIKITFNRQTYVVLWDTSASDDVHVVLDHLKIGRASCRESVCQYV